MRAGDPSVLINIAHVARKNDAPDIRRYRNPLPSGEFSALTQSSTDALDRRITHSAKTPKVIAAI
jgi:hypothetical protein